MIYGLCGRGHDNLVQPQKTNPEPSVIFSTFVTCSVSTKVLANFLSVAITTPSFAQIPNDVRPLATALRAYSIWRSFPVRLKVVRLNEYAESPIVILFFYYDYNVEDEECDNLCSIYVGPLFIILFTVDVYWSILINVQCSMLNAQCSMLNCQCCCTGRSIKKLRVSLWCCYDSCLIGATKKYKVEIFYY